MNTRGMQIVTVAGALVAGFAGGCLSRVVSIPARLEHLPSALPTVRASSFEVVDEHGRVRARLGSDGPDPALELLDEKGRIRATLRLEAYDRGLLAFSDDRWEGRAMFGHLGCGDVGQIDCDNWGLAIFDPNERRIDLGLTAGESDGHVRVRSPSCSKPFDCLP